jgi:hypothetical protein
MIARGRQIFLFRTYRICPPQVAEVKQAWSDGSAALCRLKENAMGLAIMILGLALFLGVHALTACREQRAGVVARLGEGPYKGLYSLISIAGVVLIGWGFGIYRATGWIDVWSPPAWTRHLTVALVWIAVICVVAAYSPGRIKQILKHPMLVGVKLWAVAHLVSNGDLGSIILFGSILAWAVFDRISLKHRTDPGGPPVPVGGVGKDVAVVLIGTAVYLALGFLFHPYVVGVPAFGK